MKKILTITLNPCVDRTIYFEHFQVGGTNVVKKVIEEAAGKGINVAIGLQHLQVPVKAMGFAYKEDKDKLYEKLAAEQIPYSFVEVDGRLRVNQKLFDESKSEMTECNEKGMPVSKEDVDKLLQILKEELRTASILVLSGSVPPGVDKDIYAVMTYMANEARVKVILDTSGELLLEGVKAKPYLIKPNREEFVKTFMQEQLVNKRECAFTLPEEGEESEGASEKIELLNTQIRSVAEKLIENGVTYICLSLGADGAILISKSAYNKMSDGNDNSLVIEKRPAISVPIRSLQGAGDAMVAGLCKAIYDNDEDKMLDYALNMAASTIMLEGTQMGNKCR